MRLLIIDDDKLVCESLRLIVEVGSKRQGGEAIEVVGIGHDGKQAIDLFDETFPDILLMDIRMEDMDGIAAGKVILSAHPNAKILYLTTFLDDAYILDALRIGAKGYLMKSSYDAVLPALYAVQNGQRVFGDEIIEKLPYMLHTHEKGNADELSSAGITEDMALSQIAETYGLNTREIDLIRQIAEGKNNKEIAEALHFSEGTVRNYLSVILEKLNLRDRTQLAVFYYKHIDFR